MRIFIFIAMFLYSWIESWAAPSKLYIEGVGSITGNIVSTFNTEHIIFRITTFTLGIMFLFVMGIAYKKSRRYFLKMKMIFLSMSILFFGLFCMDYLFPNLLEYVLGSLFPPSNPFAAGSVNE